MRQASLFTCLLLAVCATGHGCQNGATKQSSKRVLYAIDQLLQKGMDQQAAFSALGVTHRRERDFSSSILRTHYAVLCERFSGQEVQLDFGLFDNGWRLEGWVLFDHVRQPEVSDWVPADSDWAKEQDQRIAAVLRQFAAEDQENCPAKEPGYR
mgnify:FL=1